MSIKVIHLHILCTNDIILMFDGIRKENKRYYKIFRATTENPFNFKYIQTKELSNEANSTDLCNLVKTELDLRKTTTEKVKLIFTNAAREKRKTLSDLSNDSSDFLHAICFLICATKLLFLY